MKEYLMEEALDLKIDLLCDFSTDSMAGCVYILNIYQDFWYRV